MIFLLLNALGVVIGNIGVTSNLLLATEPQLSTSSSEALEAVMPRLSQFLPALHHALMKARSNPPEELSASVERQAREYLMGLKEEKVKTTFWLWTHHVW